MMSKKLMSRKCACGCGSEFKSTRELDFYASLACAEIALQAPSLFTTKHLAEYFGLVPHTVHRWYARGWIRPKKMLNGRPLFDLQSVMENINALRNPARKRLTIF